MGASLSLYVNKTDVISHVFRFEVKSSFRREAMAFITKIRTNIGGVIFYARFVTHHARVKKTRY